MAMHMKRIRREGSTCSIEVVIHGEEMLILKAWQIMLYDITLLTFIGIICDIILYCITTAFKD